MKKDLTYISKFDDVCLHACLEFDNNSTKAIVQIFHGMAEHKERYEYFINKLVENGYAVLNCDLRGHGESAIIKGYFADEDGWFRNVDDLYELYLLAKKELDLPLIVFGHSMGTIVTRSYLKKYEDDITKICMTGFCGYNSATAFAIPITKVIRKFKGKEYRSEFMNGLSFGSFNKEIENPKTDFDWLSVNEDNVKEYMADKDCGYIFTIQGYLDLFYGMNDIFTTDGWNVKKNNLPIKILCGKEDPCFYGEKGLNKAVDIMKSVGYKNISVKLFDGLRHEILNEKEKDVVIKEIIEFLDN